MIKAQALQWVREAIAHHVDKDYVQGDTLLLLAIEANRAFLADNLELEDLPFLEIREQFLLEDHQFDALIPYKEFDLGLNTRVRTQFEIVDVSENTSYRAQMFPSQAEVQKLSEQISGVTGVDQVRDIIPVYRNGNICQVYDSTAPADGWIVGIDYALISKVSSPQPLGDVNSDLRLKDEHEYYALKLTYADVMTTLLGDARYKDIKTQILAELGLQK